MDPGKTHAVAALLQRMMLGYYADVRMQAQMSLYVAFPAAIFSAVAFSLSGFVPRYSAQAANAGSPATIRSWVIAGSVLGLIAAISLFSYTRSSRRLGLFHVGLERTNRFILADALCEKLEATRQDYVRQTLVDVVAQAPMLTIDGAAQRVPEVAPAGREDDESE
jgi:hypothetical protein